MTRPQKWSGARPSRRENATANALGEKSKASPKPNFAPSKKQRRVSVPSRNSASNIDNDSNFAVAYVPENFETSVEKCIDSSRGYALKLNNDDGRFVWVGLVFHDRNSAFDFFACFEEQLKRKRMMQMVKEHKLDPNPNVDFSLKKGAKIKINLRKEGETRFEDEFNELVY